MKIPDEDRKTRRIALSQPQVNLIVVKKTRRIQKQKNGIINNHIMIRNTAAVAHEGVR